MLRLFNSLTRKIEPFHTADDRNVKIYTCGPSTYQRPHIGNYRTFLYEDILQRYLKYRGYRVKRLMTLTDVEDKAIAESKRENVTLEELTRRNEAQLFKDFEFLVIKVSNFMIRASAVIDQSVKMVNTLLKKGIAYWYVHEGRRNVYFDPLMFRGFGKLAHLDMTKWPKEKRRFHKDTYPGTPWNKGDFVIWHGCKEDGVCWETEIGKGRPAWNIQDAAIVTKHLGFHVDIAAGGVDNLVRHHDYTLAVAESVSGRKFAEYWLHGAHLFVEGAKMSKSKGNVIYPDDLAAKGYNGALVRFFLIYGHYREKLNFTWEKLDETSRKLAAFRHMVKDLKNKELSASSEKARNLSAKIVSDFDACMDNDLGVKDAFDELFSVVSKLIELKKQGKLSSEYANAALANLKKIDSVLQIIF